MHDSNFSSEGNLGTNCESYFRTKFAFAVQNMVKTELSATIPIFFLKGNADQFSALKTKPVPGTSKN
jgi:hypothetical protein